ncbi:MAG TPA: hybrid sensor histidine kinase/response regulator [Polyangia bacterium]|nr:hybrid sensor histidine kinase/response regulator [Polyangia bacterium]
MAAESRELVLVIGDNLQSREVTEGHLVSSGFDAVLADSGEVGLLRFQDRRPDLVLLDVVMPRMDGFETCRRLRMLPGGTDTPVLFLTALGDLGTHKAALDSGADDFLTKPINRAELLIRIRSLLRVRRLSDQLRRNYDVTRSQRDDLLEAHRQKIELATLLVHDLKNPLSSILSNVEYLTQNAKMRDDDRESLNDVLRASRSMFRMVMNLLDISRSEDGALVPRCTELDVDGLLQEISSETALRLRERDQTLEVQVAPGTGTILADRDLVRRVIENLVDNSHKYSPRGGTITIEVSVPPASAVSPDVEGAPAIELRIRDQGAGIPMSYRTRIFEKYVRVDDRSPDEPRNSQGLGLVFCRTAIEVHGGRIWVEDNAPKGCCFCVRLPRVPRLQGRLRPVATPSPPLVVIASAR